MRIQGVFRGLGGMVMVVGSWLGLASAEGAIKAELLTGGLSRPVFVCSPPGDHERLFVVEQHLSAIRIFDREAGTFLEEPFLGISGVRRGSEQGLLGLAFHPGYETNGYFYININPLVGPRRTEIQRYRVEGDPKTSNVADASSMKLILSFTQPYDNHNGGWLGFGPDGYLYIASGDGGSGFDPQDNAQNRLNLLGKILRIDVDVEDDQVPYEIPDGNPFKGHATFREEIWAFGLRNPWRCSFDRETGDLWIGDVGQGEREEIDVIPAGMGGLNFGWRPREGFIATPGIGETPVTPATEPIFDYDHDNFGYSVTGGYVYRGQAIPELRGKYIFADYGTSRFWATTRDENSTNTVQITSDINPNPQRVTDVSSFGEDAAGELYIVDLDGEIFRIVGDGPIAATVTEVERVGEDLVMRFEALATQNYVIEASSLLGPGSDWIEVETVEPAAANRTVNITNAVTGEARYFRIRSE